MIKELGRFEYFKTYKKVKVTFLKDEENDYIENLQMLIFLGDYKEPVFATKLNTFEFYEKTVYDSERVWVNVPFITNSTKRVVTKVKLKDSELNRLKKFLSQFNLRTINLVFGEVIHNLNKLDGANFTSKPVKKQAERKVQVLNL